MAPQDWQQRVIDEQQELNVRIEALNKFINSSDVFSALPDIDKTNLSDQFSAMENLNEILKIRIGLFDTE